MRRSSTLALIAVIVISCAGAPPSTRAEVSGRLVSAPTCPVETTPPDPGCAPRPVGDATIQAERPDGAVVEAVSGEDGGFVMELDIGLWTVTFQPVPGLMGVPGPATVVVDTNAPVELGVITYDTGVR